MPAGTQSESLERISKLAAVLAIPGIDDAVKIRVNKLIQGKLSAIVKEEEEGESKFLKAVKERAVQAKRVDEKLMRRQKNCLHRKKNAITQQSETLLGGQFLQIPEGTLWLVCQGGCRKEFSIPAHPGLGWEEPPLEILPKGGIGLITDMYSDLKARQRKLSEARDKAKKRAA